MRDAGRGLSAKICLAMFRTTLLRTYFRQPSFVSVSYRSTLHHAAPFSPQRHEKRVFHEHADVESERERCEIDVQRVWSHFQSLQEIRHDYLFELAIMLVPLLLLQTIAYAAVLVRYASAILAGGCHPAYSPGKTYAYGDWVSVSTIAVTPSNEGGEFSFSEVYNYQCKSPDNTMLCSNDEFAPGSIHSEQAWTQEISPCSAVSQHMHPN